jgi:hypothetical protein
MRRLSLRLLLLVAVAWLAVSPAAAVTYQFATPISGDVVQVTASLEDVLGGVDFTVSIAPGSGDLLGLFGSVTPESLVPQLSVANPTGVVTQWQFQANAVWKVGGGNTMSPVKTFDFGVKLGQTGGGGGALTEASFGLRAPGLTVASITGASTQGWVLGVRIQGTSGPEGSSKLGLAVGTPPASEPPTIAITSPGEGALLATSVIAISGTVTGAGVAVSVDGTPASVGGGSFETTLTLADGSHTLVATATNAAGSASDQVSITVDTTPPVVTITAPAEGAQTTEASVLVTGTVADASPIVSFTVNGAPATLAPDGSFAVTVPLALGPQAITALATDAAGHPGSASVPVTRGEAPAIVIASPAAGALFAASPLTITGTLGGTEPIAVTVNGVAAAVSGGSFTASVPLVEGANTLTATATNAFGEASASTPVTLDTTPPVVTITSPANGSLTAEASTPVTGTVFDASPIASLTMNGVAATVTGSAFSASVALALGENQITATATDAAGHSGNDAISVTRGTAPTIAIASPVERFETDAETILVSGSVSGTEPLLVSVNGVPAMVSNGSYSATVPLAEGANTLSATATNPLGSASASVSGTRTEGGPLLAISIATPPNGAFVSKETVAVAGLVSDPGAQVTVNGAPATVTGTGYVAPAVALEEGPNTLVAVATRGAETAQAQALVTYNAPPRVVITSPIEGTVLRQAATDVEGVVDDPSAFVDVNGVSATVASGGRFTAPAVPLEPGENNLLARAVDLLGAQGNDQVRVTRDDAAAPRLRLVVLDRERFPFELGDHFAGPAVVADDLASFLRSLESAGIQTERFQPPVDAPSVGTQEPVHLYAFAEEPGEVTIPLVDEFSTFPVEILRPIGELEGDLVAIGLDGGLVDDLLPKDFEAHYFARFDLYLGFGGGS